MTRATPVPLAVADSGGAGIDVLGLDVDADLHLEITTPAGVATIAHVPGSGQQVRVEVARPEIFLSVFDRTGVGRLADTCAAVGVAVQVVGPGGRVATLGAGTSSRLGRTVTGSAWVAPAPRVAVQLGSSTWAGRVAAFAAPVLLVALVAICAHRRGSSSLIKW